MTSFFSRVISSLRQYVARMYARIRYGATPRQQTPLPNFLDLPVDIHECIIAGLIRNDIPSALALTATCRKMRNNMHAFVQLPEHLALTDQRMSARLLLCAWHAGVPLAQFPITATGTITYLAESARLIGLLSDSPALVERIQCISTTFAEERRTRLRNLIMLIGNIDIDDTVSLHIAVSSTCVADDCKLGDRVCVTGTLHVHPSPGYTEMSIRVIEYRADTIRIVV